MIRIACEDRRDRAWLERFVRGRALPARLGREDEGWELLLCRDGSIRGLGQLVTCGSDPRCTLTVSSLLQEGGMAALQREIRTGGGLRWGGKAGIMVSIFPEGGRAPLVNWRMRSCASAWKHTNS